MVEVVAALIWDGEQFLVCQRPAHKARALLWEFVGGKVEPGETKEEALVRECQEELAVKIRVGDIFTDVLHEYPDIKIHLTLFHANIAEGTPQLLEHNDIRWITASDIDALTFCPADKDILVKIKAFYLERDLHSLADQDFRMFQSKLIPTISSDRIIGVRMPELRKYVAKLSKLSDTEWFLNGVPHSTLEENNIHGLLISDMRNYSDVISALDRFLPFVDNWMTCDLLSPKVFTSHRKELKEDIRRWLQSDHPFTVRFAIRMLMEHYLGENFDVSHLALVAAAASDHYYVNMGIAWYYATALARNYSDTVAFLEQKLLPKWIHNKTIQKANESFRLTPAQKAYLKTFKMKETE